MTASCSQPLRPSHRREHYISRPSSMASRSRSMWGSNGDLRARCPREAFPSSIRWTANYIFRSRNFSRTLCQASRPSFGIGHDALNDKAVIARYGKLPASHKIEVDDSSEAFSHLSFRILRRLCPRKIARRSGSAEVGLTWVRQADHLPRNRVAPAIRFQ
jgi:hypothetical protein